MSATLAIVRVAVEEIVDLRWRVLRADLPREMATFDGDDEAASVHLAARDAVGRVVGCVSVHRRPFEAIGHAPRATAWQLRGMATEPELRGSGLGWALLRAAEAHATAEAMDLQVERWLWAKARKTAVPFYERHGWVIVSDEFEVPTAGPHRRMVSAFRA